MIIPQEHDIDAVHMFQIVVLSDTLDEQYTPQERKKRQNILAYIGTLLAYIK